jgi:glycerol-3-phosphate acyltransferase PlsY
MLRIISGIIISYLVGSIPTAYIFGRLLKGIDIRKFGSGNVGATNALRVLGKGPGISVLVLDILKGLLVVTFFADILSSAVTGISAETLRIIFGLSCICGHNWTVFLKFKGGKGIATTFGVLLGLAIKIGGLKVILALSVITWLVIFFMSRIVSLSSVITGIALSVYMFAFKQSNTLKFLSIILSIFIILRHKSNLKRILQGKESRLTFKKTT